MVKQPRRKIKHTDAVKLPQPTIAMLVNRLVAHRQPLGDHLGVHAVDEQTQDFLLARR